MKTIASILKSINEEDTQCHNCKAKEGAEHPLKGMKVVLKKNENSKHKYCQICLIEKSSAPEIEKKKKMIHLTKKFCFAIVTLMALSISVMAQPGLPSSPNQAPIDGGLSLLAAAGGIYAYKKLKRENN